jgi:glycerol-3-phosphate cytidylyltransferase
MEKKVLYTGGTFDLFHSGHVNFLRQCKKIADTVVVSLNPDEFIYTYKGFAPFYTYEQRKELLESCVYCDQVIPNSGGQDSTIAIEKIQPQFVAIGTDWAQKDYYAQMNFTQEWLDDRNIVLLYLPYTAGISSTEIKKKIAEFYNS